MPSTDPQPPPPSPVGRFLIPALALGALFPSVSGGMALVGGLAASLLFGNPYRAKLQKWTPLLLKASIIGLGGAMNLHTVAQVGIRGTGYTLVGITGTLAVGALLGRLLHSGRNTSLLVSVGTAICGGSAIAAIAPILKAKNEEISIALVTVFLLNAVALLLFPAIGHFAGLSGEQFGLWSALAIHDTSSVVGASLAFGPEALAVGTTVKLARTLWIVPVGLACAKLFPPLETSPSKAPRVKLPVFIAGFLATAAVVTWIPALRPAGELVAVTARRALVLTLFFIGAGIHRDTLREVGYRPFLQGLLLWILTATVTLFCIVQGWISL